MATRYLTIDAKHRQMRGFHASLADFSVTDGEEVRPDIVCDSPQFSLYSLEDAEKQAIFVELPPDVDLSQSPFVYETQYEQAQRLIAMPYDTFQQVGQQLPPVQHLIMIYITGRSGSTLLSHLFNELDSVLSLSEPDVATRFVSLRAAYGSRDTELRDLLDCTIRFLFKPTPFKTPSTLGLKLRNEGTQLIDLYQATFPQAKNLFLYRDALGFVASVSRLFQSGEPWEDMPVDMFLQLFRQVSNYDITHLLACLDEGTAAISQIEFLTLWWLSAMEMYLDQHARGMPVLAVRYDDLNTYRERVLAEVFTYCDLPPDQAQATLSVFARDAQAGTELAREKPQEGNKRRLSDEQRDEVLRILQRHPVVNRADFVVPGTLRV